MSDLEAIQAATVAAADALRQNVSESIEQGTWWRVDFVSAVCRIAVEAAAPILEDEWRNAQIEARDRLQLAHETCERQYEHLRGLVGLLSELEWACEEGTRAYCPICGASQADGHKGDCRLANAHQQRIEAEANADINQLRLRLAGLSNASTGMPVTPAETATFLRQLAARGEFSLVERASINAGADALEEVTRLDRRIANLEGAWEATQDAEAAARTKLVEIRTLIYRFLQTPEVPPE